MSTWCMLPPVPCAHRWLAQPLRGQVQETGVGGRIYRCCLFDTTCRDASSDRERIHGSAACQLDNSLCAHGAHVMQATCKQGSMPESKADAVLLPEALQALSLADST